MFKEINKLKSETEGMVTSGRDCTTLLRFQELKNNFGPGEVVPTFHLQIQYSEGREVGRYLSLRPVWSTDLSFRIAKLRQ